MKEAAMDSIHRREKVLDTIQESAKPISASALASLFHVSRQLIVGDVALLRASGHTIIATPRGYLWEKKERNGITSTIAVVHGEHAIAEEIYTVIDLGGSFIDVIVEHPLYGQLCGKLHLYSRYDAKQFLENIHRTKAAPLSNLTNGLHLHTIRCSDKEVLARIMKALKEKGFLYHEQKQ